MRKLYKGDISGTRREEEERVRGRGRGGGGGGGGGGLVELAVLAKLANRLELCRFLIVPRDYY